MGDIQGREAFKALVAQWRAAVPDVQCIVDGNVAVSLTGVSLIVTGPSPLRGAATPQAWRSEEIALGERLPLLSVTPPRPVEPVFST